MTSDAFRDVFPVTVDFSAAEQLTDTKLDQWATQTDTGLATISGAIGDLWGDNLSSNALFRHDDRPADIVNLARAIGPMSMLNPIMPGRDEEFSATYSSSNIPSGVNEFALIYPPLKITEAGDFGITYTIDRSTGANTIHAALNSVDAVVFANHKSSKAACDAAGDYYVDYHGRVYTYTPTGSYAGSNDIVYDAYMYPDTYDKARFNVIPDWSETTVYCECSDHGTHYTIEMPTIDAWPRYDSSSTAVAPNSQESPPTSYKPKLPWALYTNFNGVPVPDGFIQLWDDNSGQVVDGLTFTVQDEYILQVTGGTLTTGTDRYRIMTVGTTITEMLNHLRHEFFNHNHSSYQYSLRSGVSHSNLTESSILASEVSSKWSTTVSSPPSIIDGNDHPQYLMRYGWKSSIDDGQYDNAMLGDLFIAAASSDYTSDAYSDNTADSNKIYFSSTDNYLFYDASGGHGSGSIMAHGGLDSDSSVIAASYLCAGNGSSDGWVYFGTPNDNAIFYDDTYSAFGFRVDDGVGNSNIQAGSFLIHLANNPIDSTSPPSSYPYIAGTVPSGGAGTYDPTIRLQSATDANYSTIVFDESVNNLEITSSGGLDLDTDTTITIDVATGNIESTVDSTYVHKFYIGTDYVQFDRNVGGSYVIENPSTSQPLFIQDGDGQYLELDPSNNLIKIGSSVGPFNFASCEFAVMPTDTSAPTGALVVAGSFYYNPSTHVLYIYDGTGWHGSTFT